MFKKIEEFSHYLVDKYIKGTKLEIDKCKYSVHGILSFIINCIAAIIFSFIFGYHVYIIFIISLVLWLRSDSGGSHAKSPRMCFTITNINYILIGLHTIYLDKYYLIFFIISFFAFTYLRNIPRYTKNAPRHKIEKQKKFRMIYILKLLLLFIVNSFLVILLYNNINSIWLIDISTISIMISVCVLINRFFLTDFSFWILEKFE